jgi:hypothetical protein
MNIALALVFVLAMDVAAAEPWMVTRGTMDRGRQPGSFVLATEAAPARFSDGEVVTRDAVRLPYRLDVTWRRLGPEAGRSMHVTVAGGVVLIRSGKIGLYAFDEARFAAAGWTPLPGYDAHAEHAVCVVQTHETIAVTIDGRQVARFSLPVAHESVRPGIGMKGAPGFRSTIYVRSLSVTEL